MKQEKILSIATITFLILMAISLFVAVSCSNHIEDLIVPPEPTVDVDVDVEIDFKTLILGYDSATNTATATGLGENAVYSWFIDGNAESEAFVSKNGAVCELNPANLSVGIHTLLVVGTLDGVEYSSYCKITISSN